MASKKADDIGSTQILENFDFELNFKILWPNMFFEVQTLETNGKILLSKNPKSRFYKF